MSHILALAARNVSGVESIHMQQLYRAFTPLYHSASHATDIANGDATAAASSPFHALDLALWQLLVTPDGAQQDAEGRFAQDLSLVPPITPREWINATIKGHAEHPSSFLYRMLVCDESLLASGMLTDAAVHRHIMQQQQQNAAANVKHQRLQQVTHLVVPFSSLYALYVSGTWWRYAKTDQQKRLGTLSILRELALAWRQASRSLSYSIQTAEKEWLAKGFVSDSKDDPLGGKRRESMRTQHRSVLAQDALISFIPFSQEIQLLCKSSIDTKTLLNNLVEVPEKDNGESLEPSHELWQVETIPPLVQSLQAHFLPAPSTKERGGASFVVGIGTRSSPLLYRAHRLQLFGDRLFDWTPRDTKPHTRVQRETQRVARQRPATGAEAESIGTRRPVNPSDLQMPVLSKAIDILQSGSILSSDGQNISPRLIPPPSTDSIASLQELSSQESLPPPKDDKLIGLYFSGFWCPPCRKFTGELKHAYANLKGQGKDFDIIFCSRDKSFSDYKEYVAKMPWARLPFHDPRIQKLVEEFQVTSIPTLIIMRARNGEIVNSNARWAIPNDLLCQYYPWEKAYFQSWFPWAMLGGSALCVAMVRTWLRARRMT